MFSTLAQVQARISARDVLVTMHATRELANDQIALTDVLDSAHTATVVEDYPDHRRGPCVLVRQSCGEVMPIHVLWGLRTGTDRPAVLITAYRPDPAKWSADILQRRP